ncbi:CDHR2 isoform 7 [Pan troglodytes]|uniref:Cadherin related family member 2 n=2 Tax=Homininae TaxID=207598 RepID=D6REJ3_HUMAN|nr:cadherin related family member 2 [Homo sapiens]KAI4024019.1 cadherin related family member 2 [Homo sapiens]PNI18163.1 CDHR2 isoform 7 [Pan troglodytes]
MAQLWLSCFLLPALVVSVAANVAPKFLANMTSVILPEDLPVVQNGIQECRKLPDETRDTKGY